jgi:trehalose 2-sulfotransferase
MPTRATTAYLILSTPRSGSTLLCRGLESTNLAGQPHEYFRPDGRAWKQGGGDADPVAYVDRLLAQRASANGIFGAKVSWRHMLHFERACRSVPRYGQMPLPEILPELFPRLRYVRLTRRDKLRQAISFWKAYQTGEWGRAAGKDNETSRTPEYDHDAITNVMRMLQEHETAIDEFFAQSAAQPFTVVYEEFVPSYEATMRALLRHLDIEAPPDLVIAGPRMERQADADTEAWVARYRSIAQEQSHGFVAGREEPRAAR